MSTDKLAPNSMGLSLLCVLFLLAAVAACRQITPPPPAPSPELPTATRQPAGSPAPTRTAGAEEPAGVPPTPQLTLAPLPTQAPPGQTPPAGSVWQVQIDLAKQDLAQRLDVETTEIEILEIQAVVWPDASLGCPQPGMSYLQVQQDGLLIRLSVSGKAYEYHSGGGRPPFLCERPAKEP